MSSLTCLACGAETSNGLALCDLCRRKASTDLEFIPVYYRNLARWRPGRAGSRQVPGSRVLYDGETRTGAADRISRALDETMTALTTWARALADDRGPFPRPLTLADAVLTGDLPDELAEQLTDEPAMAVRWLCTGLDHHLVSVATLGWCGDLVHELRRHEARLRTLTEQSIPGWYAGACKRRVTMDEVCGAPTYVIPGLTWVTCGSCGATTYARDHLDTILDEARGWVAPPKRLAEAIVALVDTEQSVPRLNDRIRQWGTRERIETIRAHDYAPRRYRLGDVLDRIRAEGETRLSDDERQVTA